MVPFGNTGIWHQQRQTTDEKATRPKGRGRKAAGLNQHYCWQDGRATEGGFSVF